MSILCAIDFTEGSRLAATTAAALARRLGVPLWLMHASEERGDRKYGEAVQALAQRSLDEEVARLKELGVDAKTVLTTGPLDMRIADAAKDKQAQWVFVGRPAEGHDRRRGKTELVAQACPAPVVIVRNSHFAEFIEKKRTLKVVLGVDRSRAYEEARRWVEALTALGPIEVIAAHAFWPGEESRRMGLPPPPSVAETPAELKAALEQEVRNHLGALGKQAQVRLRLSFGRLGDELVDVAREESADLLVVGSHAHGGLSRLWSVSHVAVRFAPMSVAVVPARADVVRRVPAPQTVLVPTDLSAASGEALANALGLLPADGELVLFHAVREGTEAGARIEVERKLAGLVPTDELPPGARVRVEVVGANDLPKAIIQAAERTDADLVCMGTNGISGLSRAVLGSVTKGVLGSIRRPVLVVGPQET